MSNSQSKCIEYLNSVIVECETYDLITRDLDLQIEACQTLQGFLTQCADLKTQAITKQNEEFANVLLGFECVASSLISSLKMWILLKQQKPDEAWDQLINAQSAAMYAAKADRHFNHLLERVKSLEWVEKNLFPPQVFVSAGLIVRCQECSICGIEYGECEHLAGKPYWGEFCSIVAKDIEANHVSFVQSPADKRCRIVQFTVEGGDRNRMTWKVTPHEAADTASLEAGENSDKRFLKAQAHVIYCGE